MTQNSEVVRGNSDKFDYIKIHYCVAITQLSKQNKTTIKKISIVKKKNNTPGKIFATYSQNINILTI